MTIINEQKLVIKMLEQEVVKATDNFAKWYKEFSLCKPEDPSYRACAEEFRLSKVDYLFWQSCLEDEVRATKRIEENFGS